jgi:hypothetical protein
VDTKKIAHVFLAIIFVAATVLVAGCAQKSTGTATQTDQTDWEWVPCVWVEDNSFAGRQYDRCVFDENTFGYLCPPGTK